jgi:PAS domain S-box-containing protein
MNPARILHLEDSTLDAEFVRERLGSAGLAAGLDLVTDRSGFIAKLKAERYDLILSDYQVPTFEGLAALDLAKSYQPDTPFIFVSGAMGEEAAVEALKRGATDYVLKDRLIRLPAAVERALAEAREKSERQQAEARARSILESMNDAFVLLDPEWRMSYVNSAFEAMNDVRREQVLGRIYWEMYPSTVGTFLESEYQRVMADGVTVEMEHFDEPQGRWFVVKAYPAPEGGICVQSREITEAKLASRELARREEELKVTTDAIPALISYVDREGYYRFVNRQYEVWFGKPREEVLGRHLRDVLGQQAYESILTGVDRVLRGERFDFEAFVPYRDGGGRHVHVSYVPRVEDGEVVGFFALVSDISDRKKAELVHEESKRRLRLALRGSRMGTWDLDLTTGVMTCSETCKANYGRLPTDAFSYEDLARSVHEDDRRRWEHAIQEAISRAADFEVEYRVTWPDQSVHWVNVRGTCIPDERGEIVAVSGLSLDITERRRVEESLRENERRVASEAAALSRLHEATSQLLADEKRHAALLERVAAASRSMNSVLSAESVVRILTEEAREILGACFAVTSFTTDEGCHQEVQAAVTDPSHDLSVDPRPTLDQELARKVCEENRPIRIPRAGESLALSGRLAAPLMGHGEKNLGVIQLADKHDADFTLEDEAVLAQLAAIASAGLENARLYERIREQDQRKDEFLATLAHELRNPLAPVRNALQILRLGVDDPTTLDARNLMERQVAHMVRLIDDLLDVSRITRGKVELKREPVDLRVVLDAALEVSQPLIHANGHGFFASRAEEPLVLDADPTRIAQVVSNLLNNAAKYTPEGGRIELSAERDGREAVIRVRDNGVGIPREMLPKVFELFTQVGRTIDRSQGGLGIGLALVHRLVGMHDGTVAAESDGLGQGSTFVVRLPLADTPMNELARKLDGHDSKRSVTPRRILVVDDNVDAAISLAMLLQLSGHTTRTAHNGPEALTAARAYRPEVVFLDIGLPGMNGYEVATRLRGDEALKPLYLVALTGWGTEEDRKRAKESGFDHHLTKPAELSAVEQLLAKLPEGC